VGAQLDLFDQVATLARKMPESLFTDPDDDWTPVAFLEGPQGIAQMPLEPFMEDDQTKDILADTILPQLITETKTTRVIMVLSVWTSATSASLLHETGKYVPPSQHDDRREAVYLIEYTRDGVQRQTHADIIRHETKPPSLGEWSQIEKVTSFEGRFVGPIVAALKRVRQEGGERDDQSPW
jgi:hypothetical protein